MWLVEETAICLAIRHRSDAPDMTSPSRLLNRSLMLYEAHMVPTSGTATGQLVIALGSTDVNRGSWELTKRGSATVGA